MAIRKVINNLVFDIKSDLNPKLFGAFGDTPSYVEGRLDDLIAIAKIIDNDILLKQFKKAEINLMNGNRNRAIKNLDSLTENSGDLTVEAKRTLHNGNNNCVIKDLDNF